MTYKVALSATNNAIPADVFPLIAWFLSRQPRSRIAMPLACINLINMKWITLFVLLSINTSLVYSQDTVSVFTDYSTPTGDAKDFQILKYSRYSDEEPKFEFDVVYFLNSHGIIASENYSELSIRIMLASNTYSEHDFAHGETTSKIVIATSEIDMAPSQSIFVIMPLFNPKLVALQSIDSYNAKLTLEHGYYNKRQLSHFRVSVDDIELITN